MRRKNQSCLKFYLDLCTLPLIAAAVLTLIIFHQAFPFFPDGGLYTPGVVFEAKEYSKSFSAVAKSKRTNYFESNCTVNVLCIYNPAEKERFYSITELSFCDDEGNVTYYPQSMRHDNHIVPYEWNDYIDDHGTVWEIKIEKKPFSFLPSLFPILFFIFMFFICLESELHSAKRRSRHIKPYDDENIENGYIIEAMHKIY